MHHRVLCGALSYKKKDRWNVTRNSRRGGGRWIKNLLHYGWYNMVGCKQKGASRRGIRGKIAQISDEEASVGHFAARHGVDRRHHFHRGFGEADDADLLFQATIHPARGGDVDIGFFPWARNPYSRT